MKYLKVFQTESDYNAAKDNFIYPTVSHIVDSGENHFMFFPVLDYPIKAVFYDSSTGSFIKLYPDQITEANPKTVFIKPRLTTVITVQAIIKTTIISKASAKFLSSSKE